MRIWNHVSNDFEIRAYFLPSLKTKHVDLDETYQIALLWKGKCILFWDVENINCVN